MKSKNSLSSKTQKAAENKSRARVGATAYFTAAVWAELGVPGAARFDTRKGRWLNRFVKWGGASLGLFGPYSVTNLFLASRHLGLNLLLEQLAPTQVIELAAGLSARGAEWTRRHAGQYQYIEVDQAAVIKAKLGMQNAECRMQNGSPNAECRMQNAEYGMQVVEGREREGAVHRLVAADLLEDEGEGLARRLAELTNPVLPTVIIAEGLTGYLGEASLRRLLRSIHKLCDRYEDATVLIDFYVRLDRRKHGRVALAMAPAVFFSRLARAPMQMFLQDEAAIGALVESEGFEIEQLYAGQALAKLVGCEVAPVNLFYVAQIKK